MENEESISEANCFPHPLTPEEKLRGSKARSERKTRANRLNPITSGRYIEKTNPDFLYCSGCSVRRQCGSYIDGAACSVVNADTFKKLHHILDESPSEFFMEIMKVIGEHNAAGKISGNPTALRDNAMLLMKAFELRQQHLQGKLPSDVVTLTYAPCDFSKLRKSEEKEPVALPEPATVAEGVEENPLPLEEKPCAEVQELEEPVQGIEEPKVLDVQKPEPIPKRGGFRLGVLRGNQRPAFSMI
ncbi:MAG: hypothetical protein V1676_07725 [Candidatus Diapherotrites archaeon]